MLALLPALLIGAVMTACNAPADAVDVVVDSLVDGSDDNPGDGVCEMTVGAGDCSIRAAIDEANSYAAHPLEIHVPAGVHALTRAGGNENANDTGDLDVMPANPAGLWITGDAAGAILDGNGLDRVIDHRAGKLTIYNVTITGGDEATTIDDEEGGGGIRSVGSSLKLIAAVVADNASATLGGGVAALETDLQVSLSDIRDNTAPWAPDVHGPFARASIIGSCGTTAPMVTSLGYNLNTDGTCPLGQPTDLTGVDPLLGPLANNGGPTQTMLPGVASPARNAIPNGTPGVCDGSIATDERGIARPQGAACDIGAVEQ